MKEMAIAARGHLMDSGLLSDMLNLVVEEGYDYKIEMMTVSDVGLFLQALARKLNIEV